MTKPGKMGPNSPFMEMELAIGHKSSRNAAKNAKNRIFISETVIFFKYFNDFYSERANFEKNAVKDSIMFEDQSTLKKTFFVDI